jgi:hypothetical protein
MARWFRLRRLSACGLLVASAPERPLQAQDRPAGPTGRVWLSAGVGAGQQELGCRGCARSGTIGGVALTGAAGFTLPSNAGFALAAHRFTEVSFEYSQQSLYVVALGEYDPPRAPGLTIGAGLGHGRYWGDRGPYQHHGSGLVAATGVSFRAPAASWVALSLSASYIAALTGRRDEEDPSVQPRRPLRPRLLLVAASLSLAARSPAAQITARRDLASP